MPQVGNAFESNCTNQLNPSTIQFILTIENDRHKHSLDKLTVPRDLTWIYILNYYILVDTTYHYWFTIYFFICFQKPVQGNYQPDGMYPTFDPKRSGVRVEWKITHCHPGVHISHQVGSVPKPPLHLSFSNANHIVLTKFH